MSELTLAIIGSGALASLIGGVFSLLTILINRKNGTREALQLLLYDKIEHLGRKYVLNGSISGDELRTVCEMWEVYHNKLGGNGYLDSIMSDVKALPLKK